MTSPHPLAAWAQRAVADQPDGPRDPGERFPELEEDDLDQRRRRRARTLSRARRTRTTVSRVRYS
jgi:hypothetical protein